MKKILFSLLLLCSSIVLIAQPRVGSISVMPKVGMTLSEPTGGFTYINFFSHARTEPGIVTGNNSNISTYATATAALQRKSGFTLGAEFQYQVASGFALVSGLNFAQLRSSVDLDACSSSDFTFHKITNKSNYLQIPFLVKGYLYKGLALQVGLQFDWHLKSKVEMSYDFYGVPLKSDNAFVSVNNKEYYVFVSQSHMDNIEKFGASIPMGVSYEYRNLELSAMYNISATRSSKAGDEYSSSYDMRNSTFLFTLGYRFSFLGDK